MPHSAPSSRRAYTLIEVLTVVAIIGILVGILMPAINSIRNQAQRAQCTANLKSIALGALAHQETKGRLPVAVNMPYAKPATTPGLTDASGIPPGEMLRDLLGPVLDSPTRINSDPRYPFGPNWAVYLLPYLEHAPLYRDAKVESYESYKWPTSLLGGLINLGDILNVSTDAERTRDTWRVVRDQTIPVYRCPADTMHATPWAGLPDCPGKWARGNYAANAGPGWWQMSLKGASYLENFGMTGPVMGINFGANVKQIPDGASMTAMINEVRGGVADTDPRGAWALGYPGSSVTASNAIGDCMTPNDRVDGSDDIDGCPKFFYPGIGTRDRIGCNPGIANLGWPSWQAQARSMHKGGVNVAFCDGSVRFVHDYVSQGVWFSMLSTRDGVSFSFE